jgi:signal transduction histidine kinase
MDPVLIVDDEKDNLEAIKRLLRNQYSVTVTDSPVEALKLIVKKKFNVIVSDQRMPEMSGVELLEKVKTVCPNTTRILLTGYTDIESVIGAINRGNIYRYVAKPWDPEDLRQTLRQANESFLLREEIEQKSTALSKSNAELTKALDDLRLLDQAKARFLSLISHELNTPLTALSAFVELLGEKSAEFPDEARRAVGSLASASERLAEIVSEVLTYVKLESESNWARQDFAWERETLNLIKALDSERARKQVAVSVTTTGQPKSACNPEKMRIGLKMLLREAISRAPEGSEIKVDITLADDKLTYAVWRAGEPISPKALEPLEMGGPTLRHHRNLGLGLAICKFVVDRQGGAMAIDPSGAKATKDQGARIRFTLPR